MLTIHTELKDAKLVNSSKNPVPFISFQSLIYHVLVALMLKL